MLTTLLLACLVLAVFAWVCRRGPLLWFPPFRAYLKTDNKTCPAVLHCLCGSKPSPFVSPRHALILSAVRPCPWLTRGEPGSTVTRFGLGRHLWDVPFTTFNANYLKVPTNPIVPRRHTLHNPAIRQISAVGSTFYASSLTCSKLSVLAFYTTFTRGSERQSVAIYIIAAFVFIYGVFFSFEWLIECQPMEKFWDLTIRDGSCLDYLVVMLVGAVMNSVTDAAMLLFPVWMLWNLRLPLVQKLGVLGIMMTGAL